MRHGPMRALINIDVLYLQQTFETRKFVKLTSSAKDSAICPTYSTAWRSTQTPVRACHLPFWKQNLRTAHHRYSRALTAICDAVCSGREAPTFARNIMPPSSGYKHLRICCIQDLNITVSIICSLLYFLHRDSWHDFHFSPWSLGFVSDKLQPRFMLDEAALQQVLIRNFFALSLLIYRHFTTAPDPSIPARRNPKFGRSNYRAVA